MDKVGIIAVRPLSELMEENVSEVLEPEVVVDFPKTPKKFKKEKTTATTTTNRTHNVVSPTEKTTNKTETKKSRSNRKEPLPGQLRIDSFYNSTAKTYKIEPKKEHDSVNTSVRKKRITAKKPKRRRKELFVDDTTSVSENSDIGIRPRKTKSKIICVIDLCSEDEKVDELHELKTERRSGIEIGAPLNTIQEDATPGSVEQNTTLTIKDISCGVSWETTPKILKCTSIKRKAPTKRKKSDGIAASSNGDTNLKTVDTTLEDQISMNTSNKATKMKTRSITKKAPTKMKVESKKSQKNQTKKSSAEEPTCSKSKSFQKIKKEQIPVTLSEITPLASATKISLEDKSNEKTEFHISGVLSPSDSNISCHEKSTSSNVFSSKNGNSTKLPTPPHSIRQSPLVTDELPVEITIVDDEEENFLNKKPPKSKMNGKLNFNIEETKPKRIRRPHPLPPFKVVEGTSFAVDAFRYGDIKDVTHYFLTHFHADHYIGLTKNFAYPIYMSSITAALIRVFIPIDEEFIKEIALNEPIIIKNIEITAIDANHCPGAIMLIFKTRSGKCTLHTGDFRACADMESEPIFWNNDIHTIYLDTTYLPKKYAFCHQVDSIKRAMKFLKDFLEKNVGTRILYVCGSYLVGKEKFWATIAERLSFKVWMDGNRRKAQIAINDDKILSLLVDDPCKAQLHVIPMVHLRYDTLLEYIEKFSAHFDLLLALRPSGWEKDSRPQLRGKVNIVGIEYSEHSSHDELKRFVQYLKPMNVISTVPVTNNPVRTPKIPEKWYKYDKLTGMQRDFQPAITSYFKLQGDGGGGEQTPTVLENPIPVPAEESSPVAVDKKEHINDFDSSPIPGYNSGLLNEMFISPISAEEQEEDEKLDKNRQILQASEEPIPGENQEEAEQLDKNSNILQASEDDDWLS